jgi:hypothetical protein
MAQVGPPDAPPLDTMMRGDQTQGAGGTQRGGPQVCRMRPQTICCTTASNRKRLTHKRGGRLIPHGGLSASSPEANRSASSHGRLSPHGAHKSASSSGKAASSPGAMSLPAAAVHAHIFRSLRCVDISNIQILQEAQYTILTYRI